MKIGAVARATGISVRAIRHYDQQGLLASTRAGNGYRAFEPCAVTQVRQIQRLMGAGFSLEDIRTFPVCMLLIEGARPCAETSQLQRQRLQYLEQQISALEQQRERLRAMLMDRA